MKLYEIQKEYFEIASELELNGGELTESLEQRLEINQDNALVKCNDIGTFIRHLENEELLIKNEIERLKDMQKSKQSKLDYFKHQLSQTMQIYGVEKLETPSVKLSFRKSESVEILDENLIPENYVTTKITKQPNKTEIKKAIKDGFAVAGATLVENLNLQIK